jgi:PRC-barrel domain
MKPQMIFLSGLIALSTAIVTARAQTPAQAAATQFVTQQPASEWLAHVFLGSAVQNTAGETVGDIADLVFSPAGHISTVVLGVGGFLGMGEKHVAVPYTALSFKAGPDGARLIVVSATKDTLKAAPAFVASEKTTYDKMKAGAVELKDAAAKKIDDLTKAAPAKK